MELTDGYSKSAIRTAFGSTLVYIISFALLKYFDLNWPVAILNFLYALFVILTVWVDRKGKFTTIEDAKLVTLGTALSAFAVSTLDILFNLASNPISGNWVLGIIFVVISALIQAMLFLSALFILKKNQLQEK
ncbi:hypothetical protein [Pantoea septica]|uniref:hypothetical protein n=1 Tax=Pantoea septica TaxID=472695 RepID=UPI0028A182D1|nr:hypothetical protein [Pantoea septica]